MRTNSILTRLGRLRGDIRGTGIMELGLALPILMLLLVGAADISRLVATRIDLEQAAQRTTDFALAKRPNGTSGTYLRTEAAAAAGVPADNVTVDIFLECDGVRQDDFNTICASGESRARFVSISIADNVETMFDWGALSGVIGSDLLPSTVTVTGDSLVRFQ